MKKRNEFLDIIKGITIFLVVLGHCVVNGNGIKFIEKELFWGDPIYKFIYSFHMPLFALISGYFLYFSVEKYNMKTGITKKIKHLLPPIIVFGIYRYFLYGKFFLEETILFKFFHLIFTILDGYWFLHSILYFSIIIFIVKNIFKDSMKVYIIIFLISLIIPNVVFYMGTSTILFLYPFLIGGYFFAKHQEKILKEVEKKYNFILSLVTLLFGSLLFLFQENYYIYVSGLNIFKTKLGVSTQHQLYIDVFRISAGLIGSIFILLVFYKIYTLIKVKKVYDAFVYMGKNSLEIYCFQELIIIFILKPLSFNFEKSYIINFFETIIVILLCVFINEILNKYKVLKKIHFGTN